MQSNIPQGQQATIVAEIADARLYKLVQNERTKIQSGLLRLAWLNDQRFYFISLDTFCQTIYPNTPWVVNKTQEGLNLLFPHIESGLNGIFLPQGELSLGFINSLSTIIQVIPFENAIQIQQFKTTIDIHCKDIATNPLENDNQVIGYIQKGGEAMKSGFTWLGGQIATGVNKGGQYISSKIDKQEKVEVSTETKMKYAQTKATATYTLNIAGGYLSQLFKPVAEFTKKTKEDVNQHIDKSDNQQLKQGRQIAIATWDAAGNAVSGLGTALSQVGDSVSNNTRQVVEKKYGDDVTNTFIGKDK